MPVPCERRSTGPRDRMARRTSAQRRWRRPTPYRRGSPDTPSQRGWTVADRDPGANPDPRSSVAYWRRPNQARINGKAFAANKTGRDARLDDPFEYATENIPLAEALVAGTRERRMIEDSVLDTELAEPAIGEVHLHFTADQSLRADRKDIPYHQHPDHQFRIDRRTTHRRIMRYKFATKPGQIESSVDLPH